jgi:hypothetical protein
VSAPDPEKLCPDVQADHVNEMGDLISRDEEIRAAMHRLLQRIWEDGKEAGKSEGYDDGALEETRGRRVKRDVDFYVFCAWLSASVAGLTYAVCMFFCRSGLHL